MKRLDVIWWALAVHAAWGVALIINPSTLRLVILVGLHWFTKLGVGGPLLGAILIVAAVVAAIGLFAGKRVSNSVGLLLLMPQYALLLAAFVADAQSIVSGQVDDRPLDRIVLFI